ncbi:MAG: hypothetical protein KDA38_17230, partial [Planctomycetales bacterium]|nr:hypothetical protein [Planctomycetales bacterium]
SRDGRLVFTCSEDRYIAAWDMAAEQEVFRLPRCEAKQFALTVIDDERIATAGSDNVIRIWNFAEQRELHALRGHTGTIHALTAINGSLISGSYDTTVRLWNIGGPIIHQREARVTAPAHGGAQ